MKIQYCVLDPTGNITLLVDTPVPVAAQPCVAARLMELEPEAEQVGFLSNDDSCDIALRMAGGEFCGNATMCASAIASMRSPLNGDAVVRVSGAKLPVPVTISEQTEKSWKCSVKMPQPNGMERIALSGAGCFPVVRFDGIAHVILTESIPRPSAEALAKEWCRQLHADALGMMFWNRETSSLEPLVYVPAAETLCWENSCASGTTAVGAFFAAENGMPQSLALRQPGGTLTIDVSPDGVYRLTGMVRFRKSAVAEISLD